MLTICIGFIAFVVIYASIANGEWGPAAVAGVILLFLWFASSIERRDNKAWNNRQNYWAYGEDPDWKRKKVQGTTRQARSMETDVRKGYQPPQRSAEPVQRPLEPGGVVKVCHTCGRMVRVRCELVETSEGEMLRFLCPRCRCVNMTKVGM